MTLWLYDIDGTLLVTGGAGRRALDRAFEALYGVPEAFREISFGGRTDPGIVAEAAERAGLSGVDPDAVRRAYLPFLDEELSRGEARACPGVAASLEGTGRLGVNALLTGNWEVGARRKLEAVGLHGRFAFGAYGDDSPIRDHLVPVARSRAAFSPDRVVVIGDTPADIACARAGGAVAVAVCTGWSSAEELEACRPDLLIPDLERGLEALLAI